jgi:hypothetical protein
MNVQSVPPVAPSSLPRAVTVENPNQRPVDDAEAAAFAQQVESKPDYSNATMKDVEKVLTEGITINAANDMARQREELKQVMEETP